MYQIIYHHEQYDQISPVIMCSGEYAQMIVDNYNQSSACGVGVYAEIKEVK